MGDIGFALTSGAIGAILASLVSAWLTARQEVKRLKLDTFRRIAGWRFTIANSVVGQADSTEFFAALNEAAIVFHRAPRVISALEAIREHGQGHQSENLIELLRAMMADLRIRQGTLSTTLLSTPLIPGRAGTSKPA
jgi:hypothetical protein